MSYVAQKDRGVKLINVYRVKEAPRILYRLLAARPKRMNISHKCLPSFFDHCRFIRSKPYKEWYLLKKKDSFIGSIYLSLSNEIGIFLFQEFCGKELEEDTLQIFIAKRHRLRLLANVSPRNKGYVRLFQKLGFRHIQNSYCLEPKQGRQ